MSTNGLPYADGAPRRTDFAKTKKALDTCPFCYQDGNVPRAAVVALGNRTYIACTQNEELVDGHCLIVPIQHHVSMLELDDEDWDEVKVRAGGGVIFV
jgi:hypothetical protein